MSESLRLTPSALAHFKDSLKANPNALGIRLGLKTAGCSGQTYLVDYATQQCEDDHLLEVQGIQFIVSHRDLPNFMGMEIDLVQQDFNTQLIFNNPNVASACGCGESVSFKSED